MSGVLLIMGHWAGYTVFFNIWYPVGYAHVRGVLLNTGNAFLKSRIYGVSLVERDSVKRFFTVIKIHLGP